MTEENIREVTADLYPKRKKIECKKFWIRISAVISIILFSTIGFCDAGITFIPVIFAILPANIAKKKGRYFWTWYLYGVWLGIIALIHSLCIKKRPSIPLIESAPPLAIEQDFDQKTDSQKGVAETAIK